MPEKCGLRPLSKWSTQGLAGSFFPVLAALKPDHLTEIDWFLGRCHGDANRRVNGRWFLCRFVQHKKVVLYWSEFHKKHLQKKTSSIHSHTFVSGSMMKWDRFPGMQVVQIVYTEVIMLCVLKYDFVVCAGEAEAEAPTEEWRILFLLRDNSPKGDRVNLTAAVQVTVFWMLQFFEVCWP